jgi:hypothetical protein
MRSSRIIVWAITILGLAISAAWGDDAYLGEHTGDALIFDHASTIVLHESIVQVGLGQYRYSFGFTNSENVSISELRIYTRYQASSASPFSKQGWVAVCTPLSNVFPAFDASNIDPTLAYLVGTYGPGTNFNSTNPLAVGDSVSGFSFTASVYDATPLLYAYCAQGNYPPNTGHSTAAGYTVVPEPCSLLILLSGIGGLGGLMWRKRR